MKRTILYLNTAPGDRIQGMTLAGIRRYAGARGWEAEPVSWQESRPEDVPDILAAHQPVAGCVIECADGDSRPRHASKYSPRADAPRRR